MNLTIADLTRVWPQIVQRAIQIQGLHVDPRNGGQNSGIGLGLSDEALLQAAQQIGVPIPEGYHLEAEAGPAILPDSQKGNLLKNIAIAAGTVGVPAAIGAFGGGAGAGGAVGTGVGVGERQATLGLSSLLGSAAPHVAGGGALAGILGQSIGPATGALASIYGIKTQANANKQATDAQIAANKYAADLQAKGTADALAFAKQQEDERRREWQAAQDYNSSVYQGVLGRLAPWVRSGQGALAQLAQPIPRG